MGRREEGIATEHGHRQSSTPMPAPLGLLWLLDRYFAWRWRRKMRRLLALDEIGQIRLGSARTQVENGAELSLAEIAARQARWRQGERDA